MQEIIKKEQGKSDVTKLLCVSVLFPCLFLLFPSNIAQAATLYFDQPAMTAGAGQPFKVGLIVDAMNPVNAFDVQVSIPEGVKVTDAIDGDSIINDWITRPIFDEKSHTLSFSGIVPGGFSATGGKLLVLSLEADQPGSFSLSYEPSSSLIRNDAVQSPEPIKALALGLTIIKGKDNIPNTVPDNDPPERFVPKIAASSLVFGGAWAIYFDTQDKESGIYGYKVAESHSAVADDGSLSWNDAESPYMLRDQSLSSYVYVRAVDKSGNERIEMVPPANAQPWQTGAGWLIITAIIFLAAGWLANRRSSSIQ